MLSRPTAYWLVQRLLGAASVHRHLVEQHAGIEAGQRVLDIGCGPGNLLEALPDVEYVGLDLSAEYIAAARRRYGDRGVFHRVQVSDARLSEEAPFDAVFAVGVLHHLDDSEAGDLLRLAAGRLAPTGRLVTLDPTVTGGQPALARWLALRDRGQHVRTPDGYRTMAERSFAVVTALVRHDLALVPYSHVAMVCEAPRRAGEA